MKMSGLKLKILAGFVSAAVLVIVTVGAVVTWKLNQSTELQAMLIAEVVETRANQRVGGHLKVFDYVIHGIEENIEAQTRALINQPNVETFLEKDHQLGLEKILRLTTESGDLDFAMFFDLEGDLAASLPENEKHLSLDQHFGTSGLSAALRDLQARGETAGATTISSLTRLDPTFLQNIALNDMIAEGDGALAVVSAAMITDDFQDRIGFVVLGKLLNNYIEPLVHVNEITNSAFAMFVDGAAISSAGFGEAAPRLDAGFEEQNIEAGVQSATLEAGGAEYIAACSSVGPGNGAGVAIICSGIPASEVVSAQKDMIAFGAETRKTVQMWVLLVGVISSVLFALLAFTLANGIARPLVSMTAVTGSLAAGDMAVKIPGGDRSDEIGDMAHALEQIRAVGVKATRAQASLNDVSAAILIVDSEGEVIFANKAMHRLFAQLSKDLSAELTGFAGSEIVGKQFESLHNIRELATQSLAKIAGQHRARMTIAGHTLDLAVGPVINERGDRLGTVVEWNDMTRQVAIEQEVAELVDAAGAGDFTRRLEETGAAGFMLELAKGMNKVVETVDRGLSETVAIMSALADGDLTQRMAGDYQGSFLNLKDDANRMAEQIGEIVERIVAATVSVRDVAVEIDLGASDLSSRAESQASSLEEAAAAMEEIAATVKNNAENAIEAKDLATVTRRQAERGREVVAETVQAMANIRESATEIGDIVSTIESIAFQTNLLALNAAVEAARAGDAGKGFAVVAAEVRTLAQRSGDAAKTIKDLIGKSTDHVEAGDRLVGATDSALTEILEGVRDVARTIEDIADASREQTAGVENVSSAVSQMDETTQQNASIAERSAASARGLTEQSETLVALVRFFTTRDEAGSGSGTKIGEDPDLQAWEEDAKSDAMAARMTEPAPRPSSRRQMTT